MRCPYIGTKADVFDLPQACYLLRQCQLIQIERKTYALVLTWAEGRSRGAGHIPSRRSTRGCGDPRELVDIQLLTARLGIDTRLLEQRPRPFGGTGP